MSRGELLREERAGEILLIEDNPGDARLIREMLRGIDVIDRGSGGHDGAAGGGSLDLVHCDRLSAGLERLETDDVSIVLLDLNLPDSEGRDTLERVLGRDDAPPVVVLTGVRDRDVGIEALDRGAKGYLVKDDVTPDGLLRTIYHAVERDRYERRLERQRDRLTALNSLTQELLGVETAEEIADRVVDFARTGLELPATMIALYDEEQGRLATAARTPDAARSIDKEELLNTEDGEAWRAFVEGETIRADASDGNSAESPTRDAIVPLGKHGVFVTRVPVSDRCRAQRDFLDLLAANVRGALDRSARERALRERDRTLRDQNEDLERLNRVNGVIRDIDQALVAAGSRTEIERAVCTQLTAGGPYAFAWIGEYDAVDDVVEPVASGGDGDADALASAGADDGTGPRPTDRAIETREPQVVGDLLGDPPVPPWRRAALDRGYRACVVLPLTYKETLYGILAVYSERTGAFDRLERDVLAELGETVGYAINAVESKKALASDEFVEVEFVVRDPSLPLLAVTEEVGCTVELESVIAHSNGDYRVFLTTRGAPAESILAFLNRELASDEARLVSEDGDERLFECTVDRSSFVGTLLDHGAVPQQFAAEDGEGRVVVRLPESADVRTFLGTIKTTYADAEMVARREKVRERATSADFVAELDEALTDRQREVLETAYESGYFESPRGRTGSEIGEALGVSQPTFNKHLRAAQRKLLRLAFGRD